MHDIIDGFKPLRVVVRNSTGHSPGVQASVRRLREREAWSGGRGRPPLHRRVRFVEGWGNLGDARRLSVLVFCDLCHIPIGPGSQIGAGDA